MKRQRPAAYERRLVLFLDFLGFKEIIGSTVKEPENLTRLLSALDLIGRIGDDSTYKSQRVTQFSDSVVVSYRVGERSAVFWLLHAIAVTVINLADRGFLVRGAVTIGDLHHDDKHVVGPAMVQAYELESQVAKYPRVILDPEILTLSRIARSSIHSANEEAGYVRDFMTEDSDGRFFFDWISWKSVVQVVGVSADGYPDYLSRLSSILRQGLKHESPGVLEKYLWVHRQYIEALEIFAAMPPEHGYRSENPGHYEAVAELPRFRRLASAAKARIKQKKA